MSETPSRRATGRPYPGDDRGTRGQYDGYDRQPAGRGYDEGYGQQPPRSGGRSRPAAYNAPGAPNAAFAIAQRVFDEAS